MVPTDADDALSQVEALVEPPEPTPDPTQLLDFDLVDGLHLIPLNAWNYVDGAGRERGKSPRDANWQHRSYDPGEVIEHVRAGNNAGVRLSESWAVLDVDPRNFPEGRNCVHELTEEIGLDLSLYPLTLTGGGGIQAWGRVPAPSSFKSKVPGKPGLEFRSGSGMQCVAPGSRHPSGKLYQWCPFGRVGNRLTGEQPAGRTRVEDLGGGLWSTLPVMLADAPEWPKELLELVAKERKAGHSSSTARTSSTGPAIPEDERNDTLTSIAGRMRRGGFGEQVMGDRLLLVNAGRCEPPLPENEVRGIARSVSRYERGVILPTDAGNAERFWGIHQESLRQCELFGEHAWFEYQSVTGLWRKGGKSIGRTRAMQVVREMKLEAACSPDKRERKNLLSWARTSESRSKLEAMTALASARMQVAPDELDADWNLLLTPSGVLEFSDTGIRVRPPRPQDFLTKITAAPWSPTIRCPVWEDVLERVLPDRSVRDYLQRAVGYTLVGGQRDKCFFVVYGPKDSGKSTVLTAIYRTLGSYAETTRLSTFGIEADRGGNTPSLARLHGPRMILVPDVPPKKEFGTGLLKQWTGNDPVEAVAKWGHPFTFFPAGKLWFVGNHPVRIPFDDDASWRRLHVIRFEQSIPENEQDEDIGDRIDLLAVMAWMVRGWEKYREAGGLRQPDAVREAVTEYREESDPLAEFLEECTEPGGEVTKKDAYDSYVIWCSINRVRRSLSKNAFGKVVRAHEGVGEKKADKVRSWTGISLKRAVSGGGA